MYLGHTQNGIGHYSGLYFTLGLQIAQRRSYHGTSTPYILDNVMFWHTHMHTHTHILYGAIGGEGGRAGQRCIIYIHTHIFLYVYIYIHMYVYTYIYAYIYLRVCMCVNIYIYVTPSSFYYFETQL